MNDAPRPLRDPRLLALVRALDEQFRASGSKGHFGVEFHYAGGQVAGPENPAYRARIVAPTIEVDLVSQPTRVDSP